jgi:chorismate synthase
MLAIAEDEASGVDDHAEIPCALRYWREQSRQERREMARTAKDAISAGVAEQFVRQSAVEGKIVVAALVSALNAIPELSQEQRIAALTTAQGHLASLASTVPGYDPTLQIES